MRMNLTAVVGRYMFSVSSTLRATVTENDIHLPAPFIHVPALPATGQDAAQSRLGDVQRVERALVLLAYLIEIDGDIHLPMYEKLEADLEALTRGEAVRERAKRRLRTYADEAGRKTIC